MHFRLYKSILAICAFLIGTCVFGAETRYQIKSAQTHYELIRSPERFLFSNGSIRLDMKVTPCNRRLIADWWNEFDWRKSSGEGKVIIRNARAPSLNEALVTYSEGSSPVYYSSTSEAGEFLNKIPDSMLALSVEEARECSRK